MTDLQFFLFLVQVISTVIIIAGMVSFDNRFEYGLPYACLVMGAYLGGIYFNVGHLVLPALALVTTFTAPTRKRADRLVSDWWDGAGDHTVMLELNGFMKNQYLGELYVPNTHIQTEFQALWKNASLNDKMEAIRLNQKELKAALVNAKYYDISVVGKWLSFLRIPHTMQSILVRALRARLNSA